MSNENDFESQIGIKANEYPPVWQFTNECPSPPPGKWFPAHVMVSAFLDSFLTFEFFARIVVWNNGHRNLGNYRGYGMHRTKGRRVIQSLPEAIETRYHMANSCEGGGHMCVFFVPKAPQQFLRQVLSRGHYGEPTEIMIGTGSKEDPLGSRGKDDMEFLESNIFSPGDRIFTFSHDADFLYEIFL